MKLNEQNMESPAPCEDSFPDVTIIECEGIVTGGSVSERLIECRIPTRPIGLKIGDKILLKWRQHKV